MKKKIIKNNSYLSQFKKKKNFRKYNCLGKIFLKIYFKFYFNVTTYNQTYEYV